MLAITFVTILMWVSQGFDSTLHWFAYEHGFANPPEDAFGIDYFEGIGIHWSTLATIGFCALQLSLYLKTRLDIDGIINVLYSLLIGWWVAMMVFEVPYVFAMDMIHNNPIEAQPWDIWLAGYKTIYYGAGGTAGRDAVKWFLIASLLFPTQGMAAYIIIVRRYLGGMYARLGQGRTKLFFYTSTLLVGTLIWFITAQLLSPYLFPVIIRNFTWLFGFILAHGLLIYEFERPNRQGNPRAFRYRFGEPVALVLLALIVGGWLLWIYYPLPFDIVKGPLFPQTVYAFYDDNFRVITNQVWIKDDIIHTINVGLKCLVAAWTCYVFAPKLVTNDSVGNDTVFAPKLISTGQVTAGSETTSLDPHNPLENTAVVFEPPFFGLNLTDIEFPGNTIASYIENCCNSPEVRTEIERIRNDPTIQKEVERIRNDPQIAEEVERIRNDPEIAKRVNDIEYSSDYSGIVDAREGRDRQGSKKRTVHVSETHLRETDDIISSRTEKEVLKGLVTDGSVGFLRKPLKAGRPENNSKGEYLIKG